MVIQLFTITPHLRCCATSLLPHLLVGGLTLGTQSLLPFLLGRPGREVGQQGRPSFSSLSWEGERGGGGRFG